MTTCHELDLGSWCILRCASCDTLSVHETLGKAGFNVWTPVERFPAAKKGGDDKAKPILASFVFADARRIDELVRLALVPGRKHRKFWLFQHLGGFPLISDHQLAALRSEEHRRQQLFDRQKRRARPLPKIAKGTELRLTEGAFAGLTGTVIEQRGKFTIVDIPGFAVPIEISSIQLPDEQVVELAA